MIYKNSFVKESEEKPMGYILRVFYDNQFKDLSLEGLAKLVIGSSLKCNLHIGRKSLKKKHVVLQCKKGMWILKAIGEVIYNGEIVKKKQKSQTVKPLS